MIRRTFLALAAAAALTALPAAAQDEPLKVGFIYVGPIGDFGFDAIAAADAALYEAKRLGRHGRYLR